jgi:hypothetical protein
MHCNTYIFEVVHTEFQQNPPSFYSHFRKQIKETSISVLSVRPSGSNSSQTMESISVILVMDLYQMLFRYFHFDIIWFI